MGLCKCPQRKVTNIFCYEHRVNVCEHCLMQNHPKCVVDTYRNWITDSVFSSKCGLCDDELVNGDTVRLLCLHIVHWDCLDAWARSLPPTTAPAGYSCPICRKMCIFPAPNQVSPIADELRGKMSEVNWARVGLGLSLLENDPPPMKSPSSLNVNGIPLHTNGLSASNGSVPNAGVDYELDRRSDMSDKSFDGGYRGASLNGDGLKTKGGQHQHQHHYSHNVPSTSASAINHSYSHLSDNFGSPHSQPYFAADPTITTTRKTAKYDPEIPLLLEDEDKYRRRSPFESLSRWLRQMNPANKRRTRRRTAIYIIGSIIGMIILFMLLVGRNGSSSDDDTFDLHANPHVLVGEGKEPLGHDFDS